MATVAIRADGSPTYGMGHVMRGIALAQALAAAGHTPIFAVKDLAGAARATIEEYGFDVAVIDAELGGATEAKALQAIASAHGARAVIVDLNHVGTLADKAGFVDFLVGLRAAGVIVLAIEGLDAECVSLQEPLPVSAIVVPYLGAEAMPYKTLPGVRVLAGGQYFPFRSEFNAGAHRARPIADLANKILVTVGGGDVARCNEKIFDALRALQLDGLQIRMTGAAPGRGAGKDIQLDVVPSSRAIAELIRWADLAILGSGLTRYEAALLGTPSLVVSIRREHEPMMEAFARTGAAFNAGSIEDVTADALASSLMSLIGDRERRVRMSRAAMALTDGRGAARIVDVIDQLVAAG
jgi:spore coat polysaccharide biosynthesis predicted glycosyltransferase SpsG